MKTEKMKVLLYLKKSGLDKSGKAPIMGWITIGRSIAQFSCKLSCNPDLWNPRESRMDGKSREAVEVNGRLENLLLSIQSAYQSLLARGCPFGATEVKELFQGSVQTRCMLIERLDMLIKEKESHIGIDIRKESMASYHSTRIHLQEFIQKKYKVSDLALSQLTENFIHEFQQYFLGECGFQESSFYNVAAHLKTVCRQAYREGVADILLFDKVKISKSNKKLPKALDRGAFEKLKILHFEELEEEMETARDIFLFACYTGAAYCDLMEKTYRDILVKDGVVSVELVKNRLQGIATNPTTLLAMSRAELQTVKESVGRSRAEGTYLNLFYSDRNLREFVENKGVQDIPIGTITEDLFEEYRFFLKKRGLRASTINNNLCWLSRLMFRAVSKRIIRCNPFENAKYEKEEKKIRFLQKSEVMKLMSMRMNDKEAELARLLFVFSCFTGLAISDMENLEYKHIQTTADGQMYIKKERQMTKVEFIVPLHTIAEAIICHCRKEQERSEEQQTVKEKDDHLFFHRNCSRSVMDTKLSIVGKACGIRQRLSFHMARHTFGTMSLSAGIPIESIAKMMGHASISSTQVYAQVTDKKISEDMDRLIAKYKAKDKNTGNADVKATDTKTIPFVVNSNGRKEETA